MPTVLLVVFGFLLAGEPLDAPAGGKPEEDDSRSAAAKSAAPVAAAPEKASDWTPELIASRLKALEELKGIKEEDRKKASEAYKQAAEHFKSAAERAARIAARARADKEAPVRTEKLKAELKAAPPAIKIEAGAGTAKAVEAEINATRDVARAAHKRVEETEAEPKTRAERRKVLPQLTQDLRKKIDEAKKAPPVPRPGEHVELQAARQAQYAGWMRSMNAELDGLRAEAAHYDATADLASLERDLAARDKAQALKRLELLAAELTRRRREEADQALKLAESERQEKANLHPALGALAAENQLLAASRSGDASLLRSLEAAETKLSALRKQRSALKQRFQAAQDKIKQSGLNIATGQALRRQQNELAPFRNQSSGVRKRDAEIAELQGAQLDLEDRRAHLGDLDPRVREVTEGADVPLAGKSEFERQVRELLAQRRDLLQALINDHDDYLGKLVDLNTVETEMVAETEKFDKFVNERVLWLKSASAFDGRELATSAQAVKELASPGEWRDVASLLFNDARANPRTTFLTLFILTTWALLHQWLRRRLRQLGEAVEADYLNTFSLSVRALVLTCAVAAFGPSILAYLSWRLDRMYEAPSFVLAVSSGLMTAAALWITFEVLRQACRRKGLVDSHFRWKSSSVLSVRRHLTLLVMFAVPMAFIAGTLERHPNEAWRDSLGRLAFILAMGSMGVAAGHLFRAGGPVMKDLSVSKHESWLYRLRRLWAPVFVFGPLALAGLAFEGHYFTAYQFCQRLLPSIWLAIAVLLAHAKVMRWLVTARGLLAVQRAKEKRAAKADEASAAAAEAIEVETGEIDLSTVNNHVRRLARCGMVAAIAIGAWMLWGDALPKDNFFVASELWSTVSTKTQAVPKSGAAAVAGTATPVEAGFEVVTSDEVVKVAPLQVALAFGLIWITLVVAVSLPGLLEILLQSRFAADAGARYAICTLLRYAITVVGICMGCSILGVGWGQIQWLAAAMTVGLGFGLQEIFANFVSGIILLFERPIRLGDTITVGDLTGVVTRIRIRATTITDANRRELIVPNKEFITGKLVNWTLTDRSARIQLKVGIEYGTDPEAALAALLETARSHPEILAEPAPTANFETFNDSTLEMTLNVFVANLDNLARIRNELNTAIIKRFGQEGIECAHPHREVTLRAVVPGATRLLEQLEKLKASA